MVVHVCARKYDLNNFEFDVYTIGCYLHHFCMFFLQELKQPSDNRIHVLAAAYKEGYSIERLYQLTKIDRWFLSRMKCIMDYALMLKSYREKAEVTTMFSNDNRSDAT